MRLTSASKRHPDTRRPKATRDFAVPQTRGYRYVVVNDRVLLVGTSRIVVGVFADANAR
jgi:hypothetical protein